MSSAERSLKAASKVPCNQSLQPFEGYGRCRIVKTCQHEATLTMLRHTKCCNAALKNKNSIQLHDTINRKAGHSCDGQMNSFGLSADEAVMGEGPLTDTGVRMPRCEKNLCGSIYQPIMSLTINCCGPESYDVLSTACTLEQYTRRSTCTLCL